MLPAEHTGATKKRKWYKVRWNDKANPELAGRIDILSGEIYARQKNNTDVIEIVETGNCAGGVPLGFGKWSEQKIEEWIRENRK